MIRLIKNSSFKESPWKNGKGLTSEIAIFPKNATVARNDFLWRISSAKVNQSDPFSHFPSCERQLVIWKGEGLLLNGCPLFPHSPITFSGEENINCDLIKHSPVIDVGIIYKKDLINAQLEVLFITSPYSLKLLKQQLSFFFFAEGNKCVLNGNRFEKGDCLEIENEEEVFISFDLSQFKTPLILYQITISNK